MYFGVLIQDVFSNQFYLYVSLTKSMHHNQNYFIIIHMNIVRVVCVSWVLQVKIYRGAIWGGGQAHVYSYSLSRYEDRLLCSTILGKIGLNSGNNILPYFSKS